MKAGERHVLGLMLQTNAEAVASVLRSPDGADSYPAMAALAAARTLSAVVEDTLRALVAQARSEGATWQDIGSILNTTRQAAQQRFGTVIESEAPEVQSSLEDAKVRAVELFRRYGAEDWSLRQDFDEVMSERLTDEMLGAGWRQVTQAVGAFKKLGKPTAKSLESHTVVDVPMVFSGGDMKGRVAFDARGRIAGLFILNPDAV